jgi:hypothetical protein
MSKENQAEAVETEVKAVEPKKVIREDIVAIFSELKKEVLDAEPVVLKLVAGSANSGAEFKRLVRKVRDLSVEAYKSAKIETVKIAAARRAERVAKVKDVPAAKAE